MSSRVQEVQRHREAHAMTTATLPKNPPKPAKLPKLDQTRIATEAEEEVRKAMSGHRLAASRLQVASRLVAEAETEIARVRPERDEAALSLALYEGVRAVNDVIGVSRAYFHTMRCRALNLTDAERDSQWLLESAPGVRRTKEEIAVRAAANGVRALPEARDVAVSAGEATARAEAEAVAARVYRDGAIVELWNDGWTRGQIAEIAGFDASRVSQIIAAFDSRIAAAAGAK